MGTTEVTRIASTETKRAGCSSQIESEESDLDHRTWNACEYIRKIHSSMNNPYVAFPYLLERQSEGIVTKNL